MLAIHNYVIYGRPLKNGQMSNQGFSPKEPHSLHIAWRQPCSRREWETLGASENGGFNIWMRNMGCLWNWIVEHLHFVITCLASTSSFVISEVATFSRSWMLNKVFVSKLSMSVFSTCEQCKYTGCQEIPGTWLSTSASVLPLSENIQALEKFWMPTVA